MLDGFAARAVDEIRLRLDHVRQSGVIVLFAVESGSRAWGFPSPDSDYDCRFVYVRPVDDHLVLTVQRDVIEFPIVGDVDAGGWDLRKALLLALKGNAVIFEWVNSPHIYEEIAGFRTSLRDLLTGIVDPALVALHYAGLLRTHLPDQTGSVKLKKLFYALRPALCLRFMEERGFATLPPMDLHSLIEGVNLAPALRQLIGEMVEAKKITREMGTGPVPEPLAIYLSAMQRHYLDLNNRVVKMDPDRAAERYCIAQDFYRKAVRVSQIG